MNKLMDDDVCLGLIAIVFEQMIGSRQNLYGILNSAQLISDKLYIISLMFGQLLPVAIKE